MVWEDNLLEPKILILMATYNGEKYIKGQLQSIIKQDYGNWELIVQDDGSSDATCEIISKYIENDGRISLQKNTSLYHGAFANYYSLLKQLSSGEFGEKYDYVALSDQDDIWDSKRLSHDLKEISSYDEIPCLLYSNYRIIDEDNNVIIPDVNKEIGLVPTPQETLFFANAYVWGNTVMFNSKLVAQINITSRIIKDNHPHDAYLAKVALLTGKLRYIDDKLVNYRRFYNNVSADMWYKTNLIGIIKKMSLKKRSKTLGVTLDQSYFLLKEYNIDKFDDLKNAIEKGGIYGGKYLLNHGIKRKQTLRGIALYVTFISGIYKKWVKDI